jgi:protein-tyrosine phosphatase
MDPFFDLKFEFMKILMVCLGNICRSPLAQGILENKLSKSGLNWTVDSAGTSGWHSGDKPDPRSIQVAHKHNIDISHQRSRKVSGYDLEIFDVIYAMDWSNYRDLMSMAQSVEEKEKIRLILNESYPGENRDVPDPYNNDNGFEEVFEMLDKACEEIIHHALTAKTH